MKSVGHFTLDCLVINAIKIYDTEQKFWELVMFDLDFNLRDLVAFREVNELLVLIRFNKILYI